MLLATSSPRFLNHAAHALRGLQIRQSPSRQVRARQRRQLLSLIGAHTSFQAAPGTPLPHLRTAHSTLCPLPTSPSRSRRARKRNSRVRLAPVRRTSPLQRRSDTPRGLPKQPTQLSRRVSSRNRRPSRSTTTRLLRTAPPHYPQANQRQLPTPSLARTIPSTAPDPPHPQTPPLVRKRKCSLLQLQAMFARHLLKALHQLHLRRQMSRCPRTHDPPLPILRAERSIPLR